LDTLTLVLFLLGLALLVGGAELLVRGASRLAAAAGISPLVVGLTVVAYGTSSPELAVSVQAALQGQPDLTVGNVVGSNIFNVLFILGVSALIGPLVVAQQIVRKEVPLMAGVSGFLWLFAADGLVARWEAGLLFAGGLLYTAILVRQSRKETREVREEYAQEFGRPASPGAAAILLQIGAVLGGLGLLVLGSRWLVEGAVAIARAAGLSELVIGLTIVAAGTSLPEVATSILAAIRGERDISVGNVVGSNLFNILGVLGLAGLASPAGIPVPPAALAFDIPVMTAVAVACLPIFFSGNVIARWEGGLFLFYYAAYTAYLVLAAAGHDALPLFSAVMLEYVVPLTVITLAVILVRSFRRNRVH
jgi:cation:H+ antiporter